VQGTHLSNGRMNDNVERRVFEAYKDLHKRRVLHGDIRMENILVLEDDSVRIIDFDNAFILPENDVELMGREDDEITLMLKKLKNDCGNLVWNGNSH
jgi:RIO-like serine/threonine protein kinase